MKMKILSDGWLFWLRFCGRKWHGRGSDRGEISANPAFLKSLSPSAKGRMLVCYCAGCSRVCLTGNEKSFDDQ